MTTTIPTPDSPLAAGSAVAGEYAIPSWLLGISLVAGTWFFFIVLVQAIGFTQL